MVWMHDSGRNGQQKREKLLVAVLQLRCYHLTCANWVA
jgi:hypothetical protein